MMRSCSETSNLQVVPDRGGLVPRSDKDPVPRATDVTSHSAEPWRRPLTSKHAAVHRTIEFERDESPAEGRATSPNAHLKLPAPAMYRPSNNIEAWLGRVDIHMHHLGVKSSRKRALTYCPILSGEAYDRIWKLQIPSHIWEDGAALRKQLQLIFGECKTLHSYRTEFNSAKQQADEVAVEYFDRLYGLMLAAHPGEDPNTNRVLQDTFINQFVTGLRSLTLRMTMLRLHFSTLAELREAAVEQEAVEAICTGQPARQSEKTTIRKRRPSRMQRKHQQVKLSQN